MKSNIRLLTPINSCPGSGSRIVGFLVAEAIVCFIWCMIAFNPIWPALVFFTLSGFGLGMLYERRRWLLYKAPLILLTGTLIGAIACPIRAVAAAPPSSVSTSVMITTSPPGSASPTVSTITNVVVVEAPAWVTLEEADNYLRMLVASGQLFQTDSGADQGIAADQLALAPLAPEEDPAAAATNDSITALNNLSFAPPDADNPLPLPIPMAAAVVPEAGIAPLEAGIIIVVVIILIVAGYIIYKLIKFCQKYIPPTPPPPPATNVNPPVVAMVTIPPPNPATFPGEELTTPPPGIPIVSQLPNGIVNYSQCSISDRPNVAVAVGANTNNILAAAAVPPEILSPFAIRGGMPQGTYFNSSGQRTSVENSPATVAGASVIVRSSGNRCRQTIEYAPALDAPWESVLTVEVPEGTRLRATFPPREGTRMGFYRVKVEKLASDAASDPRTR